MKNTIICVPRPIQGIWYHWPLNSTKKLRFYGISGTSLQWFSSYLMNRKQIVDCDSTAGFHFGVLIIHDIWTIFMKLVKIFMLYDIADAASLFNVILNGRKFDNYALSESINT